MSVKPNTELRIRVRQFLGHIADVRAGHVKRLDRDVVLTYARRIEQALDALVYCDKCGVQGGDFHTRPDCVLESAGVGSQESQP